MRRFTLGDVCDFTLQLIPPDNHRAAVSGGNILAAPETQNTGIAERAGWLAVQTGAEGLRDALLWMTPFFAVAVFFMVLQYLALRREVQADGPVSDGGFATGVLLLLVGVAGLGARYYFGGVTGMTSTDVVPLLQMIMLVVATVLGLFLLLGAGGRKKAAA